MPLDDDTYAHISDPVERAKAKMVDKNTREQAERLEAAAQHQAAEALRAEAKATELAELLSMVKEPEQRLLRLEAYKLVMGGAAMHTLYGNQKQLQLDEKTLELAKYAILGEV